MGSACYVVPVDILVFDFPLGFAVVRDAGDDGPGRVACNPGQELRVSQGALRIPDGSGERHLGREILRVAFFIPGLNDQVRFAEASQFIGQGLTSCLPQRQLVQFARSKYPDPLQIQVAGYDLKPVERFSARCRSPSCRTCRFPAGPSAGRYAFPVDRCVFPAGPSAGGHAFPAGPCVLPGR